MSGLYPWIKALHVVAVIAWMAGMLYLPRLYVYHAAAPVGSAQSETFKTMERRLLRLIVNPAMIVAWGSGLWLASTAGLWGEGWLHGKLGLLFLMQLAHAAFARWRREFAADGGRRDARLYRVANEVPTVLLIGIVILVIVRPF